MKRETRIKLQAAWWVIVFLLGAFILGMLQSCAPQRVEQVHTVKGDTIKIVEKKKTYYNAEKLEDKVWKITVDTSEYILFYDNDNSCMVKHK